jgi:methyltransferase
MVTAMVTYDAPSAFARVPASLWLYLGLLCATGLERIVELRISKRNAEAAFARGGQEVGQGHFTVMRLLHTVFLPACFFEALLRHTAPPAPWPLLLLACALAQGLRWWAIATLGPRWNVRIVFVPGDAPVTGGPYRFLRHPNYLAVVTELACLPLLHGAVISAAVFTAANAALLWVRIRAEEAALGPGYQERFAGVSRFVPGAKK